MIFKLLKSNITFLEEESPYVKKIQNKNNRIVCPAQVAKFVYHKFNNK